MSTEIQSTRLADLLARDWHTLRFDEIDALMNTSQQAQAIALQALQENKAYRAHGYATFEECVEQRWGISRQHAYTLIAAAVVAEHIPLHNPSQVRPLLPYKDDPVMLQAIHEQVAATGNVTEARLREEVARRQGKRASVKQSEGATSERAVKPPRARPVPAEVVAVSDEGANLVRLPDALWQEAVRRATIHACTPQEVVERTLRAAWHWQNEDRAPAIPPRVFTPISKEAQASGQRLRGGR